MSTLRKHLFPLVVLAFVMACGPSEQQRIEQESFEEYCTKMVECEVEETVARCVEASKETLRNFRMYEHSVRQCEGMPEHFLNSLCTAEELSCDQIRELQFGEASCAADVAAVATNTIFCINFVGL